MIINSSNIYEKLERKMFPKILLTKVSFLCFINSDDNNGLVLYSDDEFWKPFYSLEVKEIKKLKLKDKTFQSLTQEVSKLLPDNKKLIKKAKTEFYDEFETIVRQKKAPRFMN